MLSEKSRDVSLDMYSFEAAKESKLIKTDKAKIVISLSPRQMCPKAYTNPKI